MRILRDEAGASLLEIMIATLIVSFVSLGTVEFFAKGRFWFDQEEYKRVGTQLAQEATERTVATPYGQIASWNENRTIASKSYTITVSVQNDVPDPNVKTIRSTVTWISRNNAQRSLTLSTMVAKS